MKTLEQMVAQGQAKLQRKQATMATAYNAAKERAITNYGATPFNATMKANYGSGVRDAVYIAPDPTKWATNWRAKVG